MIPTQEEYTLRKMASLLHVSTGMIYKIEEIFELRGWRSRTPGKKSIYSYHQMEFFLKVIFFSNAGIRLVDIKPLYELEKKICSFLKGHFPLPDMSPEETIEAIKDKTIDKKLDTRCKEFFLISGLFCPEDGVEYDYLKFKRDTKNARILRELSEEYREMFGKIAVAANSRYNLIGNNLNKIDKLSKAKE